MIQDKIFFDEKDPTGLSYNTPFTFYGSYQGRLWSKSPSGSIQYYTQNSDLSAYATTGSNQFSGSQAITGSLTVTGTITGTVAGTTSTASYVEYTNVANKPALVSGSAQVASFGIFATTGSNGFNGSQSITGSLTVTGQVVAQTLNVQQVTSSIVYSSGSNIFGNSLANTQQFTGSVGVTGSLTVNGASSFSSNLTATGNLNLQGAVTRNINFYDSSNTNINAQIQYDQISSNSGQLFFGTNNAGTFATRLTISNTGAATFSSSVSATTLSLSATVADYAATITNIQDDSQGLLVRATDNDSGLYLIRAQSSNSSVSQTWVDRFTLAKNGAATFSSFITAQSSGGSGLRIYGGSGTNQWDMYLNGANIRFSDNTGTGSVVFDRPLNGTSASFTDDVSLSGIKNVRWGLDDGTANARAWGIRNGYNASGDFVVLSSSTNNTTLNTVQLQIARTGAATFSSSVQTGNNITVNSSTYNWYSSSNVAFRVVDFGQYGSVYSYQDGAYYSGFAHNTYFANGTFDWRYKNTGGASNFYFQNGNLYFETAASGTAGTAAALSTKFYITSGGNVLIGDTSNASGSPTFYVKNKAGAVANIAGWNFGGTTTAENGNNNLLTSGAYYNGSSMVATQTTSTGYQQYSGIHVFYTDSGLTPGNTYSNTERMRITSGGYLKASNNGIYINSTATYHELKTTENARVAILTNSSSTLNTQNGLLVLFQAINPNNSSSTFIDCEESSGIVRFSVRSNGGIANYQANNVNLSDERTKKDIEPLESYWDKFKALEIVKFKYKDQTHDDFNIGVIAQQVEAVAPEFVDIDGWNTKPELDEEGNEIVSTEEPLKSIYTADLYHATIKVLQEAMAKIETLEAKIQTLEQQ